MKTETTHPAIFRALINVMQDGQAISKNKKNAMQGYNFRGIDDLYNALHPLFAKHGVFICSEALDYNREERTTNKGGLLIYTIVKVKFIFYAGDGSHIESVMFGEAMDSGDKSTNKAKSNALKYALMQMFLIPTEDLKDADFDTYTPAPKNYDAEINALNDCLDLEALKNVYLSLSKDAQANKTLINLKDQLKEKLTPKNQ